MEYRFATCVLDEAQRLLMRAGAPVSVEPQVFDLLALLVRNAGRVVSKDEIVDAVWGGRIVSESAISARIAAARKAVGDDGTRQAVIRTVSRRGLQMVAEVASPDVPVAAARPARPDISESRRIRYTTNARGHSVAFAVGGTGVPVLRAGYTMTDIAAEWESTSDRRMIEAIEARCRLVRFDFVGFGQSAQPVDTVDFDAAADDIRAAADAAGFDRFALFSQSGGLHSALRFAALYPDRVSRLVIMGGYVDGRMRRAHSPDTDPIRGLIQEGWQRRDSGFSVAYLLSYFPEGPLERLHEMATLMQGSCTPETVLLQRDASNHVSNSALLPLIRCPTLILHARRDGVHPLSEARKLAAGIAHAELMVLDTANHAPLYGQPKWEQFMSDLLDFLTDDAAPSPLN